MDLIVNLPYMPEKDGAVGARYFLHQGGGKISTAMAAAARLGHKAGVIAKVGGDFTGDFIVSDFIYNGVDVSRIIRGAPETASPYVLALSEAETGTRVFIGRGSSVGYLSAFELDGDYIRNAKILHLEDGGEAAAAAAAMAGDSGITVSIDADAYSAETEALLPMIDIFIGSEFYYKARHQGIGIKQACEEIRKAGPETVWFTLGKNGCAGIADGNYYEIPSFEVEVADTTGAGDVFHGAYLAAYAEGQSGRDCAVFASAAAAVKCSYPGGRTGIPDRGTLDRFLKEGVLDARELDERLLRYRHEFMRH